MEARQKAAEKMKKMKIGMKTKQDSVETNSMEEGGEGGKIYLSTVTSWVHSEKKIILNLQCICIHF